MRINPIIIVVILLSIASQSKGLYIKSFKSKEIKTLISLSDKLETNEAGIGKIQKQAFIGFPFDYSCSSDNDCQLIRKGSICWQSKCVCPDDKPIQLHKPPKCLKVAALHETCEYDEECMEGMPNSKFYCKKTNISSVCECKPGFIETIDQNKCVTGYYLNSKCTSNDQCLGFTDFSYCALSNKGGFRICQCIYGYRRHDHKCYPELVSNSDELSREDYLLRVSIGTCSVIAFIGVIVFGCSIKKKFKKKVNSNSINEAENDGYTRKEEKPNQIDNHLVENKLAKMNKVKEKEIARSEAQTKHILKDQNKIVKKVNQYCPMKEEDVCKLVKVSKTDISHHSHSHGHKHGHSNMKKHQEEVHGIDNQNYEP